VEDPGPKRNEVTGEWSRLHNEELYNLYWLPNIARVIKSRRIRQARHVTRIWEGSAYSVWFGNLRKRDHRENLGLD